jgi:hypothetical protein
VSLVDSSVAAQGPRPSAPAAMAAGAWSAAVAPASAHRHARTPTAWPSRREAPQLRPAAAQSALRRGALARCATRACAGAALPRADLVLEAAGGVPVHVFGVLHGQAQVGAQQPPVLHSIVVLGLFKGRAAAVLRVLHEVMHE